MQQGGKKSWNAVFTIKVEKPDQATGSWVSEVVDAEQSAQVEEEKHSNYGDKQSYNFVWF